MCLLIESKEEQCHMFPDNILLDISRNVHLYVRYLCVSFIVEDKSFSSKMGDLLIRSCVIEVFGHNLSPVNKKSLE